MGAFLFMRFIWKRQGEDVQILNTSNDDSITDYRRLSATPKDFYTQQRQSFKLSKKVPQAVTQNYSPF
jgi:hypothetical protein